MLPDFEPLLHPYLAHVTTNVSAAGQPSARRQGSVRRVNCVRKVSRTDPAAAGLPFVEWVSGHGNGVAGSQKSTPLGYLLLLSLGMRRLPHTPTQ